MSSSVGSGLKLNGPAAAESSCPASPPAPPPAWDIPPTCPRRAGASKPRATFGVACRVPTNPSALVRSRGGPEEDPLSYVDFVTVRPPSGRDQSEGVSRVFSPPATSSSSAREKLLKGNGTSSVWKKDLGQKDVVCLMGTRGRRSEMTGAEEAGPL